MRTVMLIIVLASGTTAAWLLSADAYTFVLIAQCSIFALWAVSYNIVYGYMGEISFGHSAYFGLGGYSLPILMSHLGVTFWAGLIGGALVAGLAAVVIGTVIRGTRGIYFAISTFVFAQAIYLIVLKWTAFTGGDNGLPSPRPDWLTSSRSYALFCLALSLTAFYLLYRVTISPAGRVIVATGQNEVRAKQVGHDTNKYRIAAFVISGLFSGLAGALFSGLIQFVSPDVLFWQMSGLVIIMTVVGGAQVFGGPIAGAIFVVVLQDLVSGLSSSNLNVFGLNISRIGEHWPLLLGVTFYAIIVYEPDGILGFVSRLSRAFSRSKTTVRASESRHAQNGA